MSLVKAVNYGVKVKLCGGKGMGWQRQLKMANL